MSDSALLEKINRMFAEHSGKNPVRVNGKCRVCGEKTVIEIVKTSGGFGINGGLLQETGPEQLNPVCLACNSNAEPNFEILN